MQSPVVTVRGLIILDTRLLVCRHNTPGRTYFNLPGGKLEVGETLEAGIVRELLEETGVKPEIGPLLFVGQFGTGSRHRIEFFFGIENPTSYAHFDATKASHQFEIAEFSFVDPADQAVDVRPNWLATRYSRVLADPHRNTEIMTD